MPEHKGQDPDTQKKKAGREDQARATPQSSTQSASAQPPQNQASQNQPARTAENNTGGGSTGGGMKNNGGNGMSGSSDTTGDGAVKPRKRRYLVARRPMPAGLQSMAAALQPMNEKQIEDELRTLGADIVKEIKPRAPAGFGMLAASGMGPVSMPGIVVAEMDVDKGEQLRRTASASVIVEHDALLKHLDVATSARLMKTTLEASLYPTSATTSTDISVRVVGSDGQPVGRATVVIYGRSFPAQGVTDESGNVILTVVGGGAESIAAIYVKPEADHWERFITRPSLKDDTDNTIQLRRLDETFPDFPRNAAVGWGQKMMGLDQLARGLTGRGVKIAIIDSGCDNSHPQLRNVKQGMDLTTDDADPDGWTNDTISHGTHCAGIIAAASGPNVSGVRGFAPEAEIFALKVFPGGRFSSLIEALDLCIERGIDVVNLSLGSDEVSELVTQKILEAQSRGVACIVAAGNSGGPVQFPGNLPNVLTVSAIGKTGEYPEDTYHAQTLDPQIPPINGIYPAKFSCFGPGIDVSAPGVAIVSCVAGGGYAAWDGTSMATPHVTGLAALLLAHHPLFQGALKTRSAERVQALFQALKASAVPCVADVQRGGAGVPTVQALLGLTISAPSQTAQAPQARPGNGHETYRDGAMIGGAPGRLGGGAGSPGFAAGQTGYGMTSWQQAPVGTPLTQNALAAWAFSNPAALQLISQMRAAGLL
ncbi:MAG TPA: S8 family serine peptidase [Pedomonas sp.]|uniref:S8 family peptidase n=1 Tax=Pedomonas sp. TaxID=2976421 RepID=UPI002F3F0CE5